MRVTDERVESLRSRLEKVSTMTAPEASSTFAKAVDALPLDERDSRRLLVKKTV